MVLTPLFGVHLLFLLFTPASDWGRTDAKLVFDIITRICEGAQGVVIVVVDVVIVVVVVVVVVVVDSFCFVVVLCCCC